MPVRRRTARSWQIDFYVNGKRFVFSRPSSLTPEEVMQVERELKAQVIERGRVLGKSVWPGMDTVAATVRPGKQRLSRRRS